MSQQPSHMSSLQPPSVTGSNSLPPVQSMSTPNSPARRFEYANALANKNNNIGMLNGNIPVTIPNNPPISTAPAGNGAVIGPDGKTVDDIWTKKILPDTRRNTLNRIQRQKSDPGGQQIYHFLNKNSHRNGIIGLNGLHGYDTNGQQHLNGYNGVGGAGINNGNIGGGRAAGMVIGTHHLPGSAGRALPSQSSSTAQVSHFKIVELVYKILG